MAPLVTQVPSGDPPPGDSATPQVTQVPPRCHCTPPGDTGAVAKAALGVTNVGDPWVTQATRVTPRWHR